MLWLSCRPAALEISAVAALVIRITLPHRIAASTAQAARA